MGGRSSPIFDLTCQTWPSTNDGVPLWSDESLSVFFIYIFVLSKENNVVNVHFEA